MKDLVLRKALSKGPLNASLRMCGGQAESNRCSLSHAGDVTGVLALRFSSPDLDTDLFKEVHEAGSKAPGLVAVTLQGADGHLSGPLGRDSNHEHCVVHQGCVCLQRRQREEDGVGIAFFSQKAQ